MKMIYCLLILLCPNPKAYCQAGLNIGDRVPDEVFNMMNSSFVSSSIAAYKGKLLIFDFIGTGCAPCVRILPRLDSLQMQYGSRVQIILVSPEKPERIRSFLKRNRYLHLPFIAADSNLSKLFPHEYISHVVWIDPAGIVRGITHPEYINTKDIDALLEGRAVNWPVKREVATYDFNQPLLTVNKSNIPEYSLPAGEFYTAFVNYMPGLQMYTMVSADSIKNLVHISLINYSIIQLYLLLYERFNFPMSQVLLQVKDPDRLVYNPAKGYYEGWQEKNFYCMDAMLSNNIPLALQREKLVSDLDFYLGLHGRIEKRSMDCLLLRNRNSPSAIKKNQAKDGLRVGTITYLLNNEVGGVPVIDETTGAASITIPITEQQLTDHAYLRKILGEYGLELVAEKREKELLVISQP